MKVLHTLAMLAVTTCIVSAAVADESTTTPKAPTKDRNTTIFPAGMVNGVIAKLTDDEITLKVTETVNTPGPNRTVNVNGRKVSVPTTKSKTVQKEYKYPLESDVKLVITKGFIKKDSPKTVQDLKAGDTVVAHLLKHSQAMKTGKPEIKFFVSQVDFAPPVVTDATKK